MIIEESMVEILRAHFFRALDFVRTDRFLALQRYLLDVQSESEEPNSKQTEIFILESSIMKFTNIFYFLECTVNNKW